MAQPTTGTSARFRQRKISVKQTLQVLWQSDVPDLEDEQQRELQQVETGVEKGEEEASILSEFYFSKLYFTNIFFRNIIFKLLSLRQSPLAQVLKSNKFIFPRLTRRKYGRTIQSITRKTFQNRVPTFDYQQQLRRLRASPTVWMRLTKSF